MTHAMQRAFERLPGVCAPQTLKAVAWAARERRADLIEFVGIIRGTENKAVYMFYLETGLRRYAIVNDTTSFVVTFLEPKGTIKLRHGEFDLEAHALIGRGVEVSHA